ncbi:MAG TPA: Omp28-related outer membrane protein [Bacteroidia bacterium]|nr:Omp28-related outer membrane protein [Bacteroidia bacterium]
MKKHISLLAIIAFASWGCDYIEVPPYVGGSSVTPVSDTVRRILIEDVTGHTCVNCPSAAKVIDSLEHLYPGQIVPVAVHFGFFAQPTQPAGTWPAGAFSEDFRVTAEDADYDAIFGCSSWSLPNGLVNRTGYPSNIPSPAPTWSSTGAAILSTPMSAYLKITPTYTASSHTLNVQVSGEMMRDTTGTYLLALYLVEDSLTGYQLDNSVSLGYDSNYVFNHVFRGCINTPGSIIGDTVLSGTIPAHTGISYSSPSFTINAAYNAAHCRVVGFIYKSDDYGVLQAAEADVE